MTLIERGSKLSFLVYGLILLFYVIGLSGFSVPLTGDQKVYLSIALEMRERSSWIIPYLQGAPNFLKPPLEYWATLVGWKIFGLNLFGALFPSVLAMLGSVFLVNSISEKITQRKSLLPGIFFASTLGTLTYATTAQMEIWIVLFYLAAWNYFLEAKYVKTFLVVGVMAWVKGPLYPVLWVMSAGLFFLLHDRAKEIASKKFILSLIFGITVGLTWYALAARTQLDAMLGQFLLKENVSKMHVSQGNPFSLWGEFLYSLFPWVFLWLVSLTQKSTQDEIKKNLKFFLSFALIPALFFTFFPYRVNTYLYLLTPLMAWFVTLSAEPIKVNAFTRGVSLVCSFFMLLLCVVLVRLWGGAWIGTELALPLMLLFGLFVFFSFTWQRLPFAILSLALISLIRMGAVEIGEKDLAGLRSFKESNPVPLAYFIEDKDIWHEFGLISTAIAEPVTRLSSEEAKMEFLNQGGAVILQDQQAVPNGFSCKDWPRIKRRLKFPLQAFILQGLKYGDPSLTRNFKICAKIIRQEN